MIAVSDFYDEVSLKFHLKLIAGSAGLGRPAPWLYLAEDESSFGFIRGGELAVTTGMSTVGKDWLFGFISSLIAKNASGLIINVGKYLTEDDITPKIKQLCNENDFVLMTMPWAVHLSDLMQSFADLHFTLKLKEDKLKNAVMSFINGAPTQEYRDYLLSLGFTESDKYTVAVCADMPSTRMQSGVYCIEGLPPLLVFKNTDAQELIKRIKLPTIGIGSEGTGLDSLAESYNLALICLKAATKRGTNAVCCRELGTDYLFAQAQPSGVERFAVSLLSPLIDYDNKHGAELVKTLAAFIKYRGSLKAVAEATACHRNTVAYRISKIKQLLNNDLEDGNTLAELGTAVRAYEYTKSK